MSTTDSSAPDPAISRSPRTKTCTSRPLLPVAAQFAPRGQRCRMLRSHVAYGSSRLTTGSCRA
ncbi:hypothetical protein [Saccharopolyspora hirsuta]|uniref:hypothetical protein n=1 Tax=Saccharopolyspora hirsuta TaxID=1837 RepID=UPI0014786F64|nr:hypothetical protein [Saccharopolyspora hirsuta]